MKIRMRNVLQFFLSVHLLLVACSAEKDKIDYGSNNGKHITIFNSRIYYEEYGKGSPLILLQGQLGGIKEFAKCIPELSKHYRVIAPDTPGQGRSELADSMSYQLITEYMSRLVDSLKIDSAYVMGLSDGGIVGILLAEKRPDKIKRVIAVGANYKLEGALPPEIPLDSLAPMPLDVWAGQNKAWIDNYIKALPRDWKKLKTDLDKMTYQRHYFSASVFANIQIPVMYVQGDKDEYIIPEHAIEMHRLTKNSQLCIVPDSGHDVFNDQPHLINQIALGFFRK
jgi:pimeloyl-ACP methyl ester carboxylesterase